MNTQFPAKPIKVVLLGECGVGKTSIITRFTSDTFEDDYITTIGATFLSRVIDFPAQKTSLKFDIWDTAGQEKYHGMVKLFYKDSVAIVLVYSIVNKNSYQALVDYWCKEVKNECSKDVIILVVANKSDLYVEEEVDEDEAKLFAKSINAHFIQSSAKTRNGIENIFQYVGMKFLCPDEEPVIGEIPKQPVSSSSIPGNTANNNNRQKLQSNNHQPNNQKKKKQCCKG